VRGQREDGPREARVEVAVLHPAVAHEHEVAHEPLGGGRGLGKAQGQLVSRVHDHVAVVDFLKQLADVSEARVVAAQVEPAGGRPRQAVARALRRARAVLLGDGVAAIAQLGRGQGKTSRLQLHVGTTFRPADAVPEDLEVRGEPKESRSTGREEPCQVEKHRLVLAGGKAEAGPRLAEPAVGVGHEQGQAARLRVGALADGDVDRAVRGMNPALGDEPERPLARSVVR
jgi:hypothetical protein